MRRQKAAATSLRLIAEAHVYHLQCAISGVVEELVAPQEGCSRVVPLSQKSVAILLIKSRKKKSDESGLKITQI